MPLSQRNKSSSPPTAPAAPNNNNNPSSAETVPLSPMRNKSNPNPPVTTQHTPNRGRLNSREITRSYSGLYGEGGNDNLLAFELAQAHHTDWLEQGGWLLLSAYVGAIAIFEVLAMVILDSDGSYLPEQAYPLYGMSWTLTSGVHLVLSIVYLHWLKGSLFDEQGEMAALTLWEQLEGRPKTSWTKRVLTIVPTLLCYASCHFSNYDRKLCMINILFWIACVMGKLPIMNGVRILGINRTAGIDDAYAKGKGKATKDL
jgi:hypothetical protein